MVSATSSLFIIENRKSHYVELTAVELAHDQRRDYEARPVRQTWSVASSTKHALSQAVARVRQNLQMPKFILLRLDGNKGDSISQIFYIIISLIW